MSYRTSCVRHPERDPFVTIRSWQVRACEGNHCAAALLSLFEHWHNIKMDDQGQAIHANQVAEQHGEIGGQNVTLLQWHNEAGLESQLLGLYKRDTIRKAVNMLAEKGFITLHKNPNPRFHFDQTRYILFCPEICSQVIESLDQGKIGDASPKNPSPSPKNRLPSPKNPSTSPPEIFTRDLHQIPSPLPSGESPPPPRMKAVKRCPAEYAPSPAVREWAQTHHPGIDVDECLEAMRDCEFTKAHSDWDATMRSWIRREAKTMPRRQTGQLKDQFPPGVISDKTQQTINAINYAREHRKTAHGDARRELRPVLGSPGQNGRVL
jgi:hypothetical protein